jgi:ZIP family zinc transporter
VVILETLIFTFLAGLAIPIGGLIARFERIGPDWLESEFRHGVIAFGAGALLSAVALVLVPEGMKHLSTFPVAACFLLGGCAFFALDLFLSSRSGQFGQLVAMLSDFLPEALALGATFTTSPETGVLLAGIIALQNCPEGFNSYRELIDSGKFNPRVVLALFAAMAFLGPIAGSLGYYFLSSHPAIIAGIMAFSAGGILYIIFQDLAPQIRLENSWIPPLGAVLGFLIGLVGKSLTEG